MKRSIILLLIALTHFSCKKDEIKLFENEGLITGINVSQCPCVVTCPCGCGGFYFHFVDTAYTSNIPIDNPQIFKLPSDIKFPVRIKINWKNTTRCGITAITIKDYEIL